MKKLLLTLTMLCAICFSVYSQTSSVKDHIVYFSYGNNVNTSSPRGTQRSPMNLSFLPLTWTEGNTIYFEWTTNIPSVQASLEDEAGDIIEEEIYAAKAGSISKMYIDGSAGDSYTIHLCINGQTYIGTFDL